jgi:hypothetical protein
MIQTDQVDPGQNYEPLLMSLVKSTSNRVDKGEERLMKDVCLSEGEWTRQNIEMPLNGVC